MANDPYGWISWRAHRPAQLGSAVLALSFIFAGAIFGFFLMGEFFSVEGDVGFAAAVLLAVIYAIVLLALPAHLHPSFGYANGVTAARAAMVTYICAIAAFSDGFGVDESLTWLVVCLSAAALAMDGVDGYLARRYRQESPLGARFDMEIDALLILALSVCVVILDKAAWWAVAIGLMRYAFVLATRWEPRLGTELPPSFRRKLVCVVQGGALCIAVAPAVSPAISAWIVAGALASLTYSFAADVVYLLRAKE